LAALPLVVMPGIIQLLDNQITSSLLRSLPPSVECFLKFSQKKLSLIAEGEVLNY